MKLFKPCATVICALLLMIAFSPGVRASDWDKATSVTFDVPTAIPGQVLPPGTYIFKTLDNALAQDMVQIWTGDQTELVATLHVIPAHVSQPYDNAVFNSDQSGQVAVLQSWFYPGNVNGFEFNYSNSAYPE